MSGADGPSSRWKCSMLGMTQTATRAPFGHVTFGRSTMAWYGNNANGSVFGMRGFSHRKIFGSLRRLQRRKGRVLHSIGGRISTAPSKLRIVAKLDIFSPMRGLAG